MKNYGADTRTRHDDDELVEDPAISLAELWIGVRNNRWLVLATVIVALACAAFYTKTRVRIYSSSASIRLDPEAPRPLGKGVGHVAEIEGNYWDRQEYYNTEFQMIQSKSTALSVARSLALHRIPGFINNLPSNDLLQEDYTTVDDAADIILSRLYVEGVKESRLAIVSFKDANPERAARVLGAVLEAYTEAHIREKNKVSAEALEWLDRQLVSLKSSLDASETDLHTYKTEKHILSVSADDQSEMLRARMAQLTGALTHTETQRAKIGARRNELRKIKGDDPAVLPADELTENDLLRRLREKYVTALELVESLKGEGKGSQHPALASAIAKEQISKDLLLKEVANIKQTVEKNYNAANQEIGSLKALYKEAETQAFELNRLAIEYKSLERARDTNEQLFSLVTEKSKEAEVTRQMVSNNIRIVDPPEVPDFPISPNSAANMLAGLVGGVFLGLAFALGRERFDSTIRRPDVVESVLGMPFLGLLPVADGHSPRLGRRRLRKKKAPAPDAHRTSELSVHFDPTGGLAEASRSIRTNIMLGRDSDDGNQVILVTSAAPGDGKTTVATALATSMGQAGQKVILVDCDMRRPRLHRVFERPNDRGLTSVLHGRAELSECVHGTIIKNLSVMCSGHLPANPAELLHTEEFATLLHELRSQYDRVILDSPPLIPVADSAILATLADSTIVVTRAFQTKKHTARRAARVLQDVNANAIGAVLNAVDRKRGEYLYYQYYDYGVRSGDGLSPPSTPSV